MSREKRAALVVGFTITVVVVVVVGATVGITRGARGGGAVVGTGA